MSFLCLQFFQKTNLKFFVRFEITSFQRSGNEKFAILSIFLLVVESWNRQHHGQTIHPTEKFNSMNLFKKFCVVTWVQLFLTSIVWLCRLLEAKNVIGSAHFGTLTQILVHLTVPVLLTPKK